MNSREKRDEKPSRQQKLSEMQGSRRSEYKSENKDSTHDIDLIEESAQGIGSDRDFNCKNLADEDFTINGLLLNPIKSGYLLSFSQSEYNSENMVYVLHIDKFKDLVSDFKAWPDEMSYHSIDASIEGFSEMRRTESPVLLIGGEDKWPSAKKPFTQYEKAVKDIWDTYLSSSAPNQICMPARVLSNTLLRIENLHLYGPNVFDETLIDPVKTLKSDVLPRFLASPYCSELRRYQTELYPLPAAASLSLRLPGVAPTTLWPDEKITAENLRAMTMIEVFHDAIVYKAFLEYGKVSFSDENVLFGRALSIFRCLWAHKDPSIVGCPPEAKDMAWIIFRYFICPGAPFEISLTYRRRKDMMQLLADPQASMFAVIEKSVFKVLRAMYSTYSFTPRFEELIPLILEAKKNTHAGELKQKRFSSVDLYSMVFGGNGR